MTAAAFVIAGGLEAIGGILGPATLLAVAAIAVALGLVRVLRRWQHGRRPFPREIGDDVVAQYGSHRTRTQPSPVVTHHDTADQLAQLRRERAREPFRADGMAEALQMILEEGKPRD